MATIDPVTGGSASTSAAALAALSAGSSKSGAASGSGLGTATSAAAQQSMFLTLLVAQMKNQDPLNPVDNSQVTTQLAQISTVDGIQQLNTTMQSMSTSMDSTQAVQGAALAGKQVLATGNSLALSQGQGIGGFQLTQAVDNLNVTITNASGAVVRHVAMGPQQAGVNSFAWDGTTDAGQAAADGTYTYQIQATAQGQDVPVTSLSYGLVNGVSRDASGFSLNIGGLGARTLDQVMQIL
jgi:flagellar basal-body rod modification protein FlgD